MDAKTHAKMEAFCEAGDNYAAQEAYGKALDAYWNAFDLIPEPKTNWEASTWVLTAIGDANFYLKDFEAGRDNLSNCMHCPGGIGNPFIHLRLGQCQLELGNKDRAADELTRAYALEGEQIFADENPKYFSFLKKKIKIESSPSNENEGDDWRKIVQDA